MLDKEILAFPIVDAPGVNKEFWFAYTAGPFMSSLSYRDGTNPGKIP